MKHLLYLNSILLLVSSCSSCDPLGLDDTCKQNYLFDIPIRVTPVQDTFQVGDTLHISIEFPTQMENQLTGDTIDMSAFPFNTEIAFNKIDVNPAHSGDYLVEYIPTIGDIDWRPIGVVGVFVKIIYTMESNEFKFKCDLVLNNSGMYILAFEDTFLDEFKGKLDNICNTDTFDMSYPLNRSMDGIDSNFKLLKLSPDPWILKITKNQFEKYGEYVFFVE